MQKKHWFRNHLTLIISYSNFINVLHFWTLSLNYLIRRIQAEDKADAFCVTDLCLILTQHCLWSIFRWNAGGGMVVPRYHQGTQVISSIAESNRFGALSLKCQSGWLSIAHWSPKHC